MNGAKRVTIIFPALSDHLYGEGWQFSESPAPPLGPLYIATPIIKAGYNVRFVDLGVDHLSEPEYFSILGETDILLISCLTNGLSNIEKIIKDYRSACDRSIVICGGPHCTETEMHIPGSDVTVYGEAEKVIAILLNNLLEGRSIKEINGISYYSDGRLTHNRGKHFIDDLDTIDPPSLELATGKNYNYIYGLKMKGIVPLITSRGCPYRCKFCTFQAVPYRERSIKGVIEEVEYYYRQGARILSVLDDNFLLKKERVEEFSNLIISRGIKLKLIVQGRADRTDPEIYRKLKKAGLAVLIFGTESANQDVLDYYGKGTTPGRIEKILDITNRLGIITFSGLIIGAPIENEVHYIKNKLFLARVPLDLVSVNILRFAYPSPLWKEAYAAGKIGREELIVTSDKRLGNFSYDELRAMQHDILKSFYRKKRRILRFLYKTARNFGIADTVNLIISLRNKALLRSPEDFHGIKISRERVILNHS